MTMLMTRLCAPVALVLGLAAVPTTAQNHDHGGAEAPYAGFEQREIKNLSLQDIEEIRRGGGWGLALPAELNGRPGPAHLLDLADELELSQEQWEAIAAKHDQMRADAIMAGERFIAAEAAISAAFAGPDVTEAELQDLLAKAAQARAALRFVHLSSHLSTPKVLHADQIRAYAVLRGYAQDPCASIPDGHSPEMWHRHNGCD